MVTRQTASFQELREFDFFREHKRKILNARSAVWNILMLLKNAGCIGYFSPPEQLVRMNKKDVKFISTIFFPGIISEKDFIFIFSLEKETKNYEDVKVFPSNFLVKLHEGASADSLAKEIARQIAAMEKGAMNEYRFFNEFLKPLSFYFPKRIPYTHYSGVHKDMKKGVDFVVGVVENDMPYKVEFQLKSSNFFIEKHAARYPREHLFVFQEWMLGNKEKLKASFFRFTQACIQSEKNVPVHWRHPR